MDVGMYDMLKTFVVGNTPKTDSLKIFSRVKLSAESVLRLIRVFYTFLIFSVPAIIALLAYRISDMAIPFIPVIYSVIYVTTAGLLSRTHAHGVVEGRHERIASNPVHFHRTLYNLC